MQRNDDDRWSPHKASRVRAEFRSAWLGWTDPVSGERLEVRMSGGEELLPELRDLGFEVLTAREVGLVPELGGNPASENFPTRSWRSLVFAARLVEPVERDRKSRTGRL